MPARFEIGNVGSGGSSELRSLEKVITLTAD
jgi:hypothetical protein